MGAALALNDLGALVLIALPLQMVDTAMLERFKGPIILIAGDNDGYCSRRQLEALHRELGGRSQLKIIEGADHFFGGYEGELAEALASMLRAVTTIN